MTPGAEDTKLEKLATLGSQFLNVVIYGGSPDETISARAYREGVLGGCPEWKRRADRLERWFPWDMGEHCKRSHEKDAKWCRVMFGGGDGVA